MCCSFSFLLWRVEVSTIIPTTAAEDLATGDAVDEDAVETYHAPRQVIIYSNFQLKIDFLNFLLNFDLQFF